LLGNPARPGDHLVSGRQAWAVAVGPDDGWAWTSARRERTRAPGCPVYPDGPVDLDSQRARICRVTAGEQ